MTTGQLKVPCVFDVIGDIDGKRTSCREVDRMTFGRWFHQPSEGPEYLESLRGTVARFDASATAHA